MRMKRKERLGAYEVCELYEDGFLYGEGEIPNDIISQQNERIQEYIKQRKWKLVKSILTGKRRI